jgi:ribosome-associated heat shock protein Hsp15
MEGDKNRDADVRVDKWLWAAHFFKTRALAAEAVSGGKIQINGERAKPSRVVRIGDRVGIRRGPSEWTIIVKDTSRLRGPAAQAQQLYEETEESRCQREAAMAQLRLERPPELDFPGWPSEKNRRAIQRFTKRGWS